MEPYAPRQILFRGLRRPDAEPAGDWALKLYTVSYRARPIDWEGFEPGLALAEASLPAPDAGAGRPGLGFLIAHQGKTGDYIVLGWWNAENELPLEVWVRRGPADPWRPAEKGESFCVWDLEVVAAERRAWIDTMLCGPAADPERYLDAVEHKREPAVVERS